MTQGVETALRVWVADDDHDDHLLMSLAVQEAGLDLELTFADNGDDLLGALRSCSLLPDLIVLDLRMPGLGGERTLRLLRDEDRTSDVPVVVFTTSTRKADRDRALDAGANSVETKPIVFDDLVDFVCSFGDRVIAADLVTTAGGN